MSPRPLAALFLVLAVVFAVYSPSLANGFAMDDRLVAMGSMDGGRVNPMVIELRPLGDYFSTHYWAGSQPADRLFRPVTVLSFALRHHLFGDMPLPAHLANVCLHLLAVTLVFLLLRALGTGLLATALGAAAFGLHAIHSEVVATVVGRAELLAFVFGAGALWAWQATRRARPGARAAGSVGAALALFLALGSKESALAWPAFFVVFAAARHWQQAGRAMPWAALGRCVGEVVAIAVVPVALFLYLRARMLAALPVEPAPVAFLVNQIAALPLAERLPTAAFVWGYGLWLTLVPFHLAADYSTFVFPTLDGLVDLRSGGVLVLFALCLLRAVQHRVAHPEPFLAAACFFGFSFLTSNVPLPIGTIFGERLYYTPSLAVAFLVAWAWRRCQGRAVGERVLLFGLGAWLAACATVLCFRHGVWRDDATLFLHEVENQPRSVRMHITAAQQNSDRGAPALATEHLLAAAEIDPDNALVWNNLGAIQLDAKNLELAERHIRRGLAARHVNGSEDLFKLHTNLGLILFAAGEVEPAVAAMQEGLRHRPGFLRIHRELLGWLGRGAITRDRLVAVYDAVEKQSPRSVPFVRIYRGLLAHAERRHDDGARLVQAGLDTLPPYADRCRWLHDVGVDLVAFGAPAAAIQRLQAALLCRPHQLQSFLELVKLTGQGALPVADLQQWLNAPGTAPPAGPAWRLYRALAVYQQGMLDSDPAVQHRARAALEAVLPDLPRWRYRGRLLAEARLELGRLCRTLGYRAADTSK